MTEIKKESEDINIKTEISTDKELIKEELKDDFKEDEIKEDPLLNDFYSEVNKILEN